MHENLDLAVEIGCDPDERESELVGLLAPPLNLTKCAQTPEHQRISRARRTIVARLKQAIIPETGNVQDRRSVSRKHTSTMVPQAGHVGQDDVLLSSPTAAILDTAETIAARYDLNPKSYRQRLRDRISWYRKPQDWTCACGSAEWLDMIAVAEEMTNRRP